ncbi:MAG: CZB domain-containing protein [Thiotrichaceae bacterium]|nr:CZB domain-containing protein [Thiotrichaceae bacterium]
MNKDNINEIIWAHSQWKSHLRKAIDMQSSHLNVADAGNDKKCSFGKWLMSVEAHRLANHDELVEIHHNFHQQAAQILQIALDGHQHVAHEAIALGSPFNKLTAELVNMISALDAA